MVKGKLEFCGEDLHPTNTHWLQAYGGFIIFISKIDMAETLPLLQYPEDEDTPDYSLYVDGLEAVNDLFDKYEFYVEGYTLRELSSWFIHYCKKYHAANKEIAKLAKIAQLQKELKELEEG